MNVSIPASTAAAESTLEPRTAATRPAAPAKPTVLVVDDDVHLRNALSIRLRTAGFDVVALANGNAALDYVKDQKVDAALLDIQMPGTDGFGVCQEIRRRPEIKDIPVFFVTGTQNGIIRDYLGVLTKTAGGDHYVTKPFDAQRLTEMLQERMMLPGGIEH